MRRLQLIVLMLSACLVGGCSNFRGARLLAPEHFGLNLNAPDIYIETGADEKAITGLRDAMVKAESAIRAA